MKSIEVSHEWLSSSELWLRYHVEVEIDLLLFPDPANAERTDNLWQSTCFELFLRKPDAADYCEFNLSPSSQWAAYSFTDYRKEMQNLELPKGPEIFLDASETHLALETTLTLPREYPDMVAAISAVMLDTGGSKSFWALAHPSGKPDFHHADCFTARLKAPESA